MTITINSRVVIQARIAEWQRHYRNRDQGRPNFLFGGSNSSSRAVRLRWFRDA
jgi:hypothetical protein